MRFVVFTLGTWGVILGLPIVTFVMLRSWIEASLAVVAALVVLTVGIVGADWLARAMNRWLYRRKS